MKNVKKRQIEIEKKLRNSVSQFHEASKAYDKARNHYNYIRRKTEKLESELFRLRQGEFKFSDLEESK